MNILFLFLDGVGLGINDPAINPFSLADTPMLDSLLSGHKLVKDGAPFFSRNCTFLSIDAQMGVAGLPQSATGQATLLTGLNFPQYLGYHYGPKPNKEIAEFITSSSKNNFATRTDNDSTTIFARMENKGFNSRLLNAYPPTYFERIESGMRNHSVIPLAATAAGIRLFNQDDLITGEALSADFTGQGWRDHLKISNTPILQPFQAGKLLGQLATKYHFSMFEFWETDIVGHRQDITRALKVIEKLDSVLMGLIENWDLDKNGIIITSDHGNLEDLSTRRHTYNQVPAIFLGPHTFHEELSNKIKSIGDIAPFINNLLSD